jgi:hypothetical protein
MPKSYTYSLPDLFQWAKATKQQASERKKERKKERNPNLE